MMNTSQYMDKQIMDLFASASPTHNKAFLDLMKNPSHDVDDDGQDRTVAGGSTDCDDGINKEEIVASYDFQPIRPLVASSLPQNLDGASRPWSSADSKPNTSSPISNYISAETIEPAKVILEKDTTAIDAVVVAEVDRTMKKYADNLLHVLESVSARLTQLESRTRHVENSVDDLKASVGNNQGSTEGKMRQLENILREVQTGVQVLKDKQDIVEAQQQLAKFQVSNIEPQLDNQNSRHIDSVQLAVSAPQQSHQIPPANLPLPPSVLPSNAPPNPAQQNTAPSAQLPNQFPQNQIPSLPQREPYFPPPGQVPEAPNQQYQLPPTQQPHTTPPASVPHQQYLPVPQQQYSQPPQLPQQHPSLPPINHPHQLQPSLSHHSEESSYNIPSQNYPPTPRPSPSGPMPSQQLYGPPSHIYEPPASRPNSGFGTGYGPPAGPSEPYPYGGSASQYGSGSTMKPHQLPSPAVSQGGGSSYPQLPTARVLPQALPTASGVGGGPGSGGSGNRVPVDDVIDKVTTMGFPREHVRATVRKLTENGQAVDLNVVLDKLMNDGEMQPQRGWSFAR